MSHIVNFMGTVAVRSLSALRVLQIYYGVTVKYYSAITEQSIYGAKDARITYNPTPTYTRNNELVVGIWNKRVASDGTLDVYNQAEPKIYVEPTFTVTLNSKVEVYLGDRTLTFRVDLIEGIYKEDSSTDNPILNVFKLVPMDDNPALADPEPEGEG